MSHFLSRPTSGPPLWGFVYVKSVFGYEGWISTKGQLKWIDRSEFSTLSYFCGFCSYWINEKYNSQENLRWLAYALISFHNILFYCFSSSYPVLFSYPQGTLGHFSVVLVFTVRFCWLWRTRTAKKKKHIRGWGLKEIYPSQPQSTSVNSRLTAPLG